MSEDNEHKERLTDNEAVASPDAVGLTEKDEKKSDAPKAEAKTTRKRVAAVDVKAASSEEE